MSTKAGKDADKFIQRMLVWEDHFYDVPIKQIKKELASKKCNGFMYIEHSWQQLGKSMAWYENQCGLVDYDSDKILREIDLQRIQGNEESPFKKSSLVHIARNKKTPIQKINLSKNLQPILIYEKINRKISYILSIDPSEGLALNNNAFTLINPHTEMVVAEYKSPYISPPDYFRMLCQFLTEYCPKSMIVIEANRGRELINRFLESKFRYQLWYDSDKLTAKKVQNTGKYGEERKAANERRALGFDTTVQSKPLLFSIIERFMEEELNKVCTEYIVKDVTCVIRKPNGKIIMGAGDDDEGEGHGDVLMSYLIGLYVLYNAKNLDEFGVHPGSSEPLDPNRELTDDEKISKMKELVGGLPPELQEMFNTVLKQKNPVDESMKYEREIQFELRKQDFERGTYESDPDMRFVNDDFGYDYERIKQSIYEGYEETHSNSSPKFNVDDWI